MLLNACVACGDAEMCLSAWAGAFGKLGDRCCTARLLESSARVAEPWSDPGREKLCITPGRTSARSRLGACALGARLAARGATSLPPARRPSYPPASSQRSASRCMVPDLSEDRVKYYRKLFDEMWALWGGRVMEGVSGTHQKGLVWMCVALLLVLPSQCADRHMHRAQTCISLHTQENTSSPSTPREAFFLYWDFWWTADFQQLVLLKWRKKAAAAGEGFNPREAAKGSCWQSSFSKATTEGDTGYYTSFIKFKRHLLNWRTSSFPITRAMQPLTTISNICRNVLFGNQAIHAAAAALPIARAGNLAHLNATGSLQYCRLVGV